MRCCLCLWWGMSSLQFFSSVSAQIAQSFLFSWRIFAWRCPNWILRVLHWRWSMSIPFIHDFSSVSTAHLVADSVEKSFDCAISLALRILIWLLHFRGLFRGCWLGYWDILIFYQLLRHFLFFNVMVNQNWLLCRLHLKRNMPGLRWQYLSGWLSF